MSPKLQPVRGTHDILPKEFEKFHAVVTRARELATLYGFKEMATPIFESTEVFSRSMGETSDVVSKEMFTFQTKGEDSVTLRPEFTAGIVRAFISNGMQQHLPLKLFSTGPAFRYERPQKGRQRQFHQVNFEWLGDASPEADVELIMLAGQLLYSLSGEKGCTLLINTLGDKENRARYREALVSYLTPFSSELSQDSQRRLTENPLRILDSKNPQDKKIITNAPRITDYLSQQDRNRFDWVCRALTKEIPYFQDIRVDSSLVRGLDYYTDIVFEFVAEIGDLGAQNTVLAGGRYDGLVEQMGGNPTPAIGFAAGVERLCLLVQDDIRAGLKNVTDLKIFVLPFEEVIETSFPQFSLIMSKLRGDLYQLMEKRADCRVIVEVISQGKLNKRMQRAAQEKATYVVFLGSEEYSRRQCKIKNMKTGNEKSVLLDDLCNKEKLVEIFNLAELDPGLRRDDGKL